MFDWLKMSNLCMDLFLFTVYILSSWFLPWSSSHRTVGERLVCIIQYFHNKSSNVSSVTGNKFTGKKAQKNPYFGRGIKGTKKSQLSFESGMFDIYGPIVSDFWTKYITANNFPGRRRQKDISLNPSIVDPQQHWDARFPLLTLSSRLG